MRRRKRQRAREDRALKRAITALPRKRMLVDAWWYGQADHGHDHGTLGYLREQLGWGRKKLDRVLARLYDEGKIDKRRDFLRPKGAAKPKTVLFLRLCGPWLPPGEPEENRAQIVPKDLWVKRARKLYGPKKGQFHEISLPGATRAPTLPTPSPGSNIGGERGARTRAPEESQVPRDHDQLQDKNQDQEKRKNSVKQKILAKRFKRKLKKQGSGRPIRNWSGMPPWWPFEWEPGMRIWDPDAEPHPDPELLVQYREPLVEVGSKRFRFKEIPPPRPGQIVVAVMGFTSTEHRWLNRFYRAIRADVGPVSQGMLFSLAAGYFLSRKGAGLFHGLDRRDVERLIKKRDGGESRKRNRLIYAYKDELMDETILLALELGSEIVGDVRTAYCLIAESWWKEKRARTRPEARAEWSTHFFRAGSRGTRKSSDRTHRPRVWRQSSR